ncbi:hypothetical protein [Streptomyces sp. NPDC051214]|uniref:hypothetical protein n=1 Tax=Streptomyces sp. NPDC051214 TaxID=3155282 RepID=UPI0034157690
MRKRQAFKDLVMLAGAGDARLTAASVLMALFALTDQKDRATAARIVPTHPDR